MTTPESGFRRTRIATAAVAGVGVAVAIGTSTLAFLDTQNTGAANAATVSDTTSTTQSANGTSTTTNPFGASPPVSSGSGTAHSTTHGS